MTDLIGRINPDGSGRGNWVLHASEHRIGTVKYCKACARPHMFPRYQAGPRELPDEQWGPVKIATFVVFAVAFVYSIVTIAAVLS